MKYLKINSLQSVTEDIALMKTIDLLPNSGKDFEINPVPPMILNSGSGTVSGSAVTGAPEVVPTISSSSVISN